MNMQQNFLLWALLVEKSIAYLTEGQQANICKNTSLSILNYMLFVTKETSYVWIYR